MHQAGAGVCDGPGGGRGVRETAGGKNGGGAGGHHVHDVARADRTQFCIRARFAGGKERHIVAVTHQLVGKQFDHELNSPVSSGRNIDPERRNERDPQSSSLFHRLHRKGTDTRGK